MSDKILVWERNHTFDRPRRGFRIKEVVTGRWFKKTEYWLVSDCLEMGPFSKTDAEYYLSVQQSWDCLDEMRRYEERDAEKIEAYLGGPR